MVKDDDFRFVLKHGGLHFINLAFTDKCLGMGKPT